MRNRVLAIVAVGVALSLGACSSGFLIPGSGGPDAAGGGDAGGKVDGGGGGGGPDGGLAVSSACSVFGTRRCGYLQRCGLIDSTTAAMRDCQAYFSATSCRASRWPARVDAGTLRYDPVLAQVCADEYVNRRCTDFESEPLACAHFLTPGSYLAGPCYGQYPECRDSVCRGAACPRTCQLPGYSGETCNEPGDCRPDAGLYCRFGSSTPGVGKCTLLGRFGDACAAELPCAAELFCNPGSVCDLRREIGEECFGGNCVSSAWCHQSPTDGGLCVERELVDQPCTDDVQCRSGLLCEPLLGICVIAGPVAEGEVCSLRQRCVAPDVCVGAGAAVLGTCLPPVKVGEPCGSSLDCEPQLSCSATDGGTRACDTRLPDEAPCEVHRDCRVFSRCVNQSCTLLPPPGSPCVAGQCLFGTCEVRLDGGPVCADIGGPGAPCLADLECGSNRCIGGKCLAACGP
ncbi:MAG: hypothetical protein ACYC8T_30120 [Myxococcaceae bacterium]